MDTDRYEADRNRAAFARYLAELIPATAPRPAADAPAADYNRPAWLDGRTEQPTRRPAWFTATA